MRMKAALHQHVGFPEAQHSSRLDPTLANDRSMMTPTDDFVNVCGGLWPPSVPVQMQWSAQRTDREVVGNLEGHCFEAKGRRAGGSLLHGLSAGPTSRKRAQGAISHARKAYDFGFPLSPLVIEYRPMCIDSIHWGRDDAAPEAAGGRAGLEGSQGVQVRFTAAWRDAPVSYAQSTSGCPVSSWVL